MKHGTTILVALLPRDTICFRKRLQIYPSSLLMRWTFMYTYLSWQQNWKKLRSGCCGKPGHPEQPSMLISSVTQLLGLDKGGFSIHLLEERSHISDVFTVWNKSEPTTHLKWFVFIVSNRFALEEYSATYIRADMASEKFSAEVVSFCTSKWSLNQSFTRLCTGKQWYDQKIGARKLALTSRFNFCIYAWQMYRDGSTLTC